MSGATVHLVSYLAH